MAFGLALMVLGLWTLRGRLAWSQPEYGTPDSTQPGPEPEQAGSADPTAFPTSTPRHPTIAATNAPTPPGWRQGRIVYPLDEAGRTSLYIIDLESTSESRPLLLAGRDERFMGPSWAPDGIRLAFYVYGSEVIVLDTGVGSVLRTPASCNSPTWSPDGTNIACGAGGLFHVLDADSGATISTFDPGVSGATLPAWSPIGNDLVFAVRRDGSTSIWRSTIGGAQEGQFLQGHATENYAPVWSPDGDLIAFQSNAGSPNSEIWIMESDGTSPTRITYSAGGWSRAPAFSPDGHWIAFVSDQAGSAGADLGEVFVVSIVTGETQQLTDTGGHVYDWRITWGQCLAGDACGG